MSPSGRIPPMQTRASAAAKQFFLTALEEQAARDSVVLSEDERRMFLFSEASATKEDADLPLKFDAEHDVAAYEAKIAKLLKRAYREGRDDPTRAALWKQSLRTLKGEDFYGMVMMQQAGLPVPDSGFDLLKMVVDLAPLTATVLLFAVPFVLLCLDPFQWNLVPDTWLRVLLFVVLGVGAWLATIVIPDRRHRSRSW